ncbi:MAG: alpha-hydroxy-acid oxidizing protein, partial [Anaerolineae bacterium]
MSRDIHEQRKAEHLRIALEESASFSYVKSGFERYRFVHSALPEIDLDEVSTACSFLGRRLAAPLLISSMTGGTPAAGELNERLARVAQELGLALALGSVRAAVENE